MKKKKKKSVHRRVPVDSSSYREILRISSGHRLCETENTKTTALDQGKASKMLAYRVR